MTIKTPGILVDVDSTLYDADPVYLKYFDLLYGVKATPAELGEYDFWKGRISLDQFLEVIKHLHSEEEILGARPYMSAAAVLRAWRARGWRLHIVSDREPSTIPATMTWLEQQGMEAEAIVLEHRIDKLAYAHAHDLGVIIDDKPALLSSVAEGGLIAASIKHAYHDTALLADPKVIIEDNWISLAQKIEERLLTK